MIKFYTICFFLLIHFFGLAQTCDLINEDMENGSTSNYPVDWYTPGVYVGNIGGNAYSGTYHLGMNSTGDSIVLPTLSCPKQICFYWITSSNLASFTLDIKWSNDNKQTWNNLSTLKPQDSTNITTYRQTCLNLPTQIIGANSDVNILLVMSSRSGGSFFLDDVCVSQGTCNAPIIDSFAFSDYPQGCIMKNNPFSIQVNAYNNLGNVDTNFNGAITLSSNIPGANLTGTTTKNAINGSAIFDNVQFDSSGVFSLKANNDSINAISNTIQIVDFCSSQDTLIVMAYNLLNFPNGKNDCSPNIQIANRQDSLRKILDYIQPDILLVCELNNQTGADLILNSSLNHSGTTKYKRANFVFNSSGFNDLNNGFFYNSEKVNLIMQDEVANSTRDFGHYKVVGNDPNLAIHKDSLILDFFSGHLKAGSSSTDVTRRGNDVDYLRTYVDIKTNGFNIFGGDLNLYTDQEIAYQTLCYSGKYPFYDPIQSEGNWSDNSNFKNTFTQSTRAFGTTAIECGATGGIDDRFDFILISDSVNNSQKIHYINNSYTALGNDGGLFNQSINDLSNNSGVPADILNTLYYMSDHLPVLMKLAINYPGGNVKDGVLENTKFSVDVYPNPTSNSIFVKLDNQSSVKCKLILFNSIGEKIVQVETIQNITPIDLSNYPTGVYVLRIENNNYTTYKRIILK